MQYNWRQPLARDSVGACTNCNARLHFMILVCAPNPAIDKTLLLAGWAPGGVWRATQVLLQAGGKGYNFARALGVLGQPALVVGPLGGRDGHRLCGLAAAHGIAHAPYWVAGETRTCTIIVDTAAGTDTVLNEPGAAQQPGEWERLLAALQQQLPHARFLAVCGSCRPADPVDGLQQVVQLAQRHNVPVLLDTHGAQLAAAVAAGPALLKINQNEAAALLGRALRGIEDVRQALPDLRARGAQQLVVTLGAAGALAIDGAGKTYFCSAPQVAALCAVGSGDSFFAGLAAALCAGAPLPAALRHGVAAGAANTLQLGAGSFSAERAQQLLAALPEPA